MSAPRSPSFADPTRRGDFIETYPTGTRFYPLDPRPEEVRIEDIAHHLSLMNRYNGATRFPLSVAQHSILVAWRVPQADKLWALLHDAAEAYLPDLCRPVKNQPEFAPYSDAEGLIMKAVCERFGLDYDQPESVTRADRAMLYHEAHVLKRRPDGTLADWWLQWIDLDVPEPPIHRWEPEYARQQFLDSFALYTRKDA